VGAVTDRLRAIDDEISISGVRPLDAVVGGALSRPRFTMLLAGSFASLALIIAGVGVFGIVGFLVTRRSHEIGVRMALGARPGNVLWLVLSEGLRPVLFGVLAGCLGAVAVARAMRALLYELAPLDGVSFAAATALLLAASLIAAALPARRAAGVDPIRSLRSE
jgi:ABC-type antimicrobial peptide transport system permease subunit